MCMLKYHQVLNIFCDTSTSEIRLDKPTIDDLVAGYVYIYNENILEENTERLRFQNHNYGELYAIYLSLKNIKKYISLGLKTINIFSDSMNSIKIIRKILENPYKFRFSSPSNNELCKNLLFPEIEKLNSMGMILNFYHIKSHKNPYNINAMENFKLSFKKMNNISYESFNLIPFEIFHSMITWNDYIDQRTRDKINLYKKGM